MLTFHATKKKLLTKVVNFVTTKKNGMAITNGRRKKYLIKSINFGQPGEPARELIDQYEKEFGSNKTSELVRRFVIYGLSDEPEFKKFKIKNFIKDRKNLFKDIKTAQDELSINYSRLKKLGLTDWQINNI